MKKFLATMVALFTPLALLAGEISVNGVGSVAVSPDNAFIHMSVVTDGTKPAQALSLNNESTNRIFTSLATLGIKKNEIQSQDLRLSAVYEYPDKQQPKLVGYRAIHTIQITVCKIEDAGKILDTVVKDGANKVDGISFGLSAEKQKDAVTKARNAAATDAVERASLYCTALGINSKSLKSLSEYNQSTGGRSAYSNMADRGMAAGQSASNVEGGEVKVTVTVQTVWTVGATAEERK